MLDFFMIATRSVKKGVIDIYPKFIVKKSSDLIIRGGDFYAVWVEDRGLWSTDEEDVVRIIDRELDRYAKENRDKFDGHVRVLHMWDAETGMIDAFHKYCWKQMRDSAHTTLDENIIFSNHETVKEDYASKKLPYPFQEGPITAYDKLMSTLYDPEEREKIEWAIGSIITGDSKRIEKFLVLYGAPGTGKSTVFNIIQQLFVGYYAVFDARALGASSNSFALEAFMNNPRVAIQHDGDLSKIEDNTRLNSLVSHEEMLVNLKHKRQYPARFQCLLFMGTNKPVKITDSLSGLNRRLIDVFPSGRKLNSSEYWKIMKQIEFELGAIAYHCREVYLANPRRYDKYIPIRMLGASNDFYNFVLDSYFTFAESDGITLKSAWEMYKVYCDEAKVPYPLSQRLFKEELRSYFKDYKERYAFEDGTRVRSYYSGFITDKFDTPKEDTQKVEPKLDLIQFNCTKSIFDKECAGYSAQYANKKGTPNRQWVEVTTKLSELDTTQLHYVKVPENHIVIDFDIPGEDGKKCFEKNLEEASKWPATYAELSKSGAGIHLHYIYTGDATKLSRVYSDHIEVKVFTGNSSLRRKLSKCNNLPIAKISSGLALKGENKMINAEVVKNERGLRTLIKKNLNKEIHPATKPSVDFIYKILEDAYNEGVVYDVTDMRNSVLAFAAKSTNQASYCIGLVNKMKFKSAKEYEGLELQDDGKIVFYDIEIFPNLFIVNWKMEGEGCPVIRMINPTPEELQGLMKFKLVGFNNRDYDNHIIYARAMLRYNNEQLYNLSQKLINKDKKISRNAKFGAAYNLSYTDIFDYAATKQSLKKWQIELGIHHQELGLPWDQPVPEELWEQVARYCDNDVVSTEVVHNHLQADWIARQILADLADSNVNNTTNKLTEKIIFGNERNPQSQFNYRNMGEIVRGETYYDFNDNPITYDDIFKNGKPVIFEVFNKKGQPLFPGYKFDFGKSTYRDEVVGEGGYIHAEAGIHILLALLDVASMHPHSIIAEELFGPKFTAKFKELVDARVLIKHEKWDLVSKMLDGRLAKYVKKVIDGEITSKQLANALKIAINSVYGLTSAKFDNAFRDFRNKDNIVAKRGALFMINLKHAVQERGFTVAHIKTDSIKIPNATPEIIEFVMKYGEKYGYTFEHEETYDRMCLVNDAVYIAKIKGGKDDGKWTATGTQFAVPYVFKKLFSRESITFEDLYETKSVKEGALYLDMNETLADVTTEEIVQTLRLGPTKKDGYTKKEQSLLDMYADISDEDLADQIAKGHDYHFVGRVGAFCPIKPEKGGGILYRINEGKNYAATGTKGYRWLEAETVKLLNKEDDIDRSYYDALVDDAVATISKYGDFEWFISD